MTEHTKPSTQHITVKSQDGHPLAGTVFSPTHEPKAVILVGSATAVKRQYYFKLSDYLAQQGFLVICFDYRCIGDSLNGHVREASAHVREWGEKDLNTMINWAKDSYPNLKLHFIGHSIGGQLLALAKDNHKLDSILHCSVQSGYWKLWPLAQRFKLVTLWYVLVPSLTRLLGYFPSKKLGVGENMPIGIIREWASWCRHQDYMFGSQHTADCQYLKQIDVPVRSYSFEGDDLAPVACVDFIAGHYDCHVERLHINAQDLDLAKAGKNIGHFDMFREPMRDALWPEFTKWFDQHS